ncbi:hypothetical protein EX30DRAFT_368932 [Ascodesmis nigricans]|uniref:Acid protease n=1 Tax=Ascodesmis nigricans TaxID=341454 RepID=A0A4S2N331_9PEZI|nr:hypothetical protein EX30DRAFT_368932 [Ascodesmis nigricans]
MAPLPLATRSLRPLLSFLGFVLLFLAGPVLSAQDSLGARPFRVAFDLSKPQGIDGPWQAVQVVVGASVFYVYPGGIWESNILNSTVCEEFIGQYCTTEVYEQHKSKTYDKIFQDMQMKGTMEDRYIHNVYRRTATHLDTMYVPEAYGSGVAGIESANVSIRLIQKSSVHYPGPGGKAYSTDLGALSLGSPDDYHVWEPWKGHFILNELELSGRIPSRTVGLHYGSVSLKQEGSLVLGGYDPSRVVGRAYAYDFGKDVLQIRLNGITHGVGLGISPDPGFKNGTKYDTQYINVMLNPTLPYMYLPRAMCEAMTDGLPVTFDADTGLYLWDTEDPMYEKLVKSPAYIGFNFPGQGSKPNTIKIPLALFDLKLEPPLKRVTTPYFPCRPSTEDENSPFTLGRSFLQGAYLGLNWHQKKFWLAQAPGPDSGATDVQPLDKTALELMSTSDNTWESSWLNHWNVTQDAENPVDLDEISKPGSSSSDSASSSEKKNGLSTGALIGISVTAVIVAVACLGIIGVCWWKSQKRKQLVQAAIMSTEGEKYTYRPEDHYTDGVDYH